MKRAAATLLACLLVAAGIFVWFAWWPEIEPVEPLRAQADRAVLEHGRRLAALGNCTACHTAPGGRSFAGGLGLPTPFGTIYSSNITPDADTGIGRWSEAAFQRAMRDGVDRAGRHLYPAFPYDHFTLVSDEDDRALYAYLMSREPVRASPPANDLPFPLNMRIVLAGWKALFFRAGAFTPDPAHDAIWNRGAYLVDGLGHCGACHTPRNRLGAEESGEALGGGMAEGWQAYAINAASPAPLPWTADSLAFYLRRGWHGDHGVSRGPMAEVTASLARIDEGDVRAIATYLAAVMGPPDDRRSEQGARMLAAARHTAPGERPQQAGQQAVPQSAATGAGPDAGAAIYHAACASCHEAGRPQPFGGLDFHLSTAVNAPRPTNIINVVLNGLPPSEGAPSAIMPGFRGVLGDAEIGALLAYLRAQFSDKPAWGDLGAQVAAARAGQPSSRPSAQAVHTTSVPQEQKP